MGIADRHVGYAFICVRAPSMFTRGFLRAQTFGRFNSNSSLCMEVFELGESQKVKTGWSLWLIAIGAGMWGLDAVFILALQKSFTSTEIVLLEHILLAFFAIPVLIWKRHEVRKLNILDWGAVLFVAWGGSAIASILFNNGLQVGLTANNVNVVLILQKLQPLFAVLLATLVLGERLRRGYWLLFAVAMFGAYLLTFGFQIPQTAAKGALSSGLYAIGAAVLWGGSTVMGKRIVNKVSFPTMTALRFAVALPFLLGIVSFQHPHIGAMAVSLTKLHVLGNLLYQTIVPSLLSLLLYYRGLNGVRASYATLAELAFPATGIFVDWLFLGQTVHLAQWIGFAIVWLAVLRLSQDPNRATTRDGASSPSAA